MSGLGGKRWEVVFRLKQINRVKWLLKKSVRQEKFAKVEELVLKEEGSSEKKMPY